MEDRSQWQRCDVFDVPNVVTHGKSLSALPGRRNVPLVKAPICTAPSMCQGRARAAAAVAVAAVAEASEVEKGERGDDVPKEA